MDMLTLEDLKKIGGLLDERQETLKQGIVSEVVTAVGQLLEDNVIPQFDRMYERLDKVEATMVTKDYLDEKLGRVDGKVNALVNVLLAKDVITIDDKRAVLS